MELRAHESADVPDIHAVINDGAKAYRGVIPADCWHEPYMSVAALESEIEAGVNFTLAVDRNVAVGVMGIQDRGEVALIRHAYVRTSSQRRGYGAALLEHVRKAYAQPLMIGTWVAAVWAIAFYRAHGFELVDEVDKENLLRRYWRVPQRQIDASVVLADGAAIEMIAQQ